jgi:hypothetical protein
VKCPSSHRTIQFLLSAILILCGLPALAAIRNVKTNCGALGDGATDDTAAINTCIGLLGSGDTLEFPAGTYRVTAQLTINVSGVTIDGSNNTATILNTAASTVGILIGQGGIGNTNAAIGSGVALSTTASEQTSSFTTVSSLGASVGSYVFLQEGGKASSTGSTDQQCDPAGCRGEVVKITGVSGNTYTVETMLHDTYIPSPGYKMSKSGSCSATSGNCATAYPISGMLSGVTIQNISFNGNGGENSGVTYGMEINDLANSTISGLTVRNVQGAAIVSSVLYGNNWSNITITRAGSGGCGAALTLALEANDTWNTASLSSLNPGAPGSGCETDGSFGFEPASGVANNTYNSISVDSAGTSGGRPVKLDAARWNTFNNLKVENGCCGFNGMSLEYYSSHNTFNSCIVMNNGGNGTGNGSAGINVFANNNESNTFSNCTVSGNGNVQFVTGNPDTLGAVANSNNMIIGGTYVGSNSIESVIIIGEPNSLIQNATISGPGVPGLSLNSYASNACVNSNTFSAGSGLTGAISSANSTNVGSGNVLNGYSSDLVSGVCGGNGNRPSPPAGLTATVQ